MSGFEKLGGFKNHIGRASKYLDPSPNSAFQSPPSGHGPNSKANPVSDFGYTFKNLALITLYREGIVGDMFTYNHLSYPVIGGGGKYVFDPPPTLTEDFRKIDRGLF